ncbi:AAA-ATPase Vps4-associated protein 1-domain-containing protein [Bombardia bombarda]|uniref:histidine kinase n=1 Tax=Bombardia bombarda TaxID=252184 RepID=A0AA39X0M0_9PEZI|nr:AAA-ATPase Vps4-associated protein 1-domain-containing protein [Bombardia bombarda]
MFADCAGNASCDINAAVKAQLAILAESHAAHVPPPLEVEVESSERARQREIAAYLSAASFPPGLPSGPPAKVFSNADPVLNALVQLGTLRLNTDRSFLSLIDRQYQYVVCETTRTSMLSSHGNDPGDAPFLGVSKLDACWGVCPTTMKAFMDETGEWIRTGPNVIANKTRYIVNDFRTDPAYADRSYVTAWPWFVSYLEVPLISPLGYCLGSYCVVDNKLNDYDNDKTVGILNEIADIIMAHLDNMRMKQSRHRSEQLINGLSDFIGYEPDLTNNSAPTLPSLPRNKTRKRAYPSSSVGTAPTELSTDRSTGKPTNTTRSGSVGSRELLTADESAGQPSNSSGSVGSPEPTTSIQAIGQNSNFSGSVVSNEPSPPPLNPSLLSSESVLSPFSRARKESDETPPTTPRDEIETNPIDELVMTGETAAETGERSPGLVSVETDELHANGFLSSANIKSTFFRAAATIRQTMNIDGLMFLDAVPSSYADRSDQLLPDAPDNSLHEETVGPFCAAIVQSALDETGEILQSSQTRLPEVTLQRFIREFPQGHVFSADEFGPIEESYGIGKAYAGLKSKQDGVSARVRNDVNTLFRVLPAAKYVLFLPLWHFQRECWYAAALGWVADPTRAVDDTDISLVSAFGNSVMAEVSRLEALAASQAKSNFVSSISHELRSPLHGILASSELLREGLTDPMLLATLDMLDSCGQTLLDTFNNLLDHAIVIDAGKGTRSPRINLQITDLGGLVEDVVEAVKISHLFENAPRSTMHRKDIHSTEFTNTGKEVPDRPLLVILNIEAGVSWQLPVNIGAWKRVVMNIFGNALKYTSSGRIEVGLKMVQRQDKSGTVREKICFSVEDTGWGMSSDYLKYQLFTPFSQENSHSPGMGLGLSIVQQLSRSLGGAVDVRSSVGVGTLVEVLVPLYEEIPGSPTALQLTANEERRLSTNSSCYDRIKGKTACLITPEAYIAMSKLDVKVTSEMLGRSKIVERALRINAGEALGMEVITGSKDCPVPQADLYFLDGNLSSMIGNRGHGPVTPKEYPDVAPLVVLCSGAGSDSCLKDEVTKNHGFHLHHPIGPRKLASVLSSALAASANIKNAAAVRTELEKTQNAAGQEEVNAASAPVTSDLRKDSDSSVLTLPSRPPLQPQGGKLVSDGEDSVDNNSTSGSQELLSSGQPVPPTSQSTTNPSQSQPQPEANARHLLLVDDNPINMTLLTTVVRKLHHSFSTACNGLEAVHEYERSLAPGQRRFDMVFMDISMPVMDGFEATREIRQLEAEAGVSASKIVALTGLSSELSRNEAFASGSDLFLTKPVKLEKVRSLLNEELELLTGGRREGLGRVQERGGGLWCTPPPDLAISLKLDTQLKLRTRNQIQSQTEAMSFPNVYTHRKVAETSAKPCDICFRPSSSVLVTPENKDFFYVCPTHLKDRGFCTPKIDQAAVEGRKKRDLEAEVERVKKEYEEKQRKKKEKEKEKEDKEKKDDKSKDKDKDKDKEDDKKKKDDSTKDETATKSPPPVEEEQEPRVFELKGTFYQQRLNRKRQAEIAKRNRERLRDPNFFPSVPKDLP